MVVLRHCARAVSTWWGPCGMTSPRAPRILPFSTGPDSARPFVALKLAASLDARIAAAPGQAVPHHRDERRSARCTASVAGFDAVMVGAGTVNTDDPRLTPRLVPPGRDPIRRILLLPDAELASDAAVLADADIHAVHVFCLETASEAALERRETHGCLPAPGPRRRASMRSSSTSRPCSHAAFELGIGAILCEGGAALGASLLREQLVDRLYLFVAPRVLGVGWCSSLRGRRGSAGLE